MSKKRLLRKQSVGASSSTSQDSVHEVAIAAISSSKKQNEVSKFINVLTSALERNSAWVNNFARKNPSFKCVFLIGSGTNCFKIHSVIYPSDQPLQLEVELQDSEDYDKIGLAVLLKIDNSELNSMLEYARSRLGEHLLLREDLLAGKAIGISFLVLKSFADGEFKVIDKLLLDPAPVVKKRKNKNSEQILTSFKKIRRVI